MGMLLCAVCTRIRRGRINSGKLFWQGVGRDTRVISGVSDIWVIWTIRPVKDIRVFILYLGCRYKGF